MGAKIAARGLSALPNEIKGLILDALPPKAYLAMGQVDRDWFAQTHSAYALHRQILALPNCCQTRVCGDTLGLQSEVATLKSALVKGAKAQCCQRSTNGMGDFWAREFGYNFDYTRCLSGARTWDELLYEAEFLQRG